MVDFAEDFSTYALSKLPSFREDFSEYVNQTLADASWVTTDTARVRANAVTEVTDFDPSTSLLQDEKMAFDLVTPLSDEKWTLRCVIDHTNITIGGDTTSTDLYIGLADNASTSWDTNQNFIGCALRISNGLSPREWRASFSVFDSSKPNGGGLSQNFGGDVFTSDIDGIEIKRISSSLLRVTRYNQDFTTVIGSVDLVMDVSFPSPTGLQFIKIGTFNADGTGDSTNTGTIDNIEIWDSPKQQGDVTFQDNFTQKPVTFTDDFSTTTNWIQTLTGVAITGSEVVWDVPNASNDGAIHHDLGVNGINDEEWVMRFKFTVSNFSDNTSSTGQNIFVAISDSDGSVTADSVQDAITFRALNKDTGDKYQLTYGDGETLFGNLVNSVKNLTAETQFVEIKRTSATDVIINLYSDSSYTTLIESIIATIPATIVGLRYIKIQNFEDDGASNGTLDGIVDDLEFYNGVSTLTGWLGTIGNDVRLDITNERINFDVPSGVLRDEFIAHDLQSSIGGNADNNNWTLRFKLNTDSITQGTSEESSSLFVGLDNNLDPTASATHDLIALRISIDQGGAGPQFGAVSGLREIDGGGYFSGGSVINFPIMWTTGTLYVELKRLSSTLAECTLYTDADYRNVSESVQITVANTLVDLRYIRITTDSSAVGNDSPWDGSIDDIEFYNGVSVPRTPVFETKDFEDSFFADNFTDVGTGVAVNTSTQVIDSTSGGVSADNGTYFDFGAGIVSDTEWALRFKINFSTLTLGAPSANLYVGLSDNNVTMAGAGTQDMIGFKVGYHNTVQGMGSFDTDGATVPKGGVDEIDFSTVPLINTDYYVEIVRTSDTTYTARLYSDPDFSILIASGTGICTNTTQGLRYLKIAEFSGGTAVITGIIDDVQFWNKQSALDHENKWRRIDL